MTATERAPLITRVRLKNYKSVASCDVRLGPLTILVGPNGSGKSNFVDALAFLAQAERSTPAVAVEERGGLEEILCRVPGPVTQSVSIVLDLSDIHQGKQFTLGKMRCYDFRLDAMRRLGGSSTRGMLGPAGENLNDVLADMPTDARSRVNAYLRAVVPECGTELRADSKSDGTVRVLAVLAALFQRQALDGRISLVGIEEPAMSLHPSGAGVLFDALTEASGHVQVVVTTHNADLLDREDVDVSAIHPVVMRHGLTHIGEVDEASQEIVRKKLYTIGQLMRGNQLVPA
jgi:predicted ATPase